MAMAEAADDHEHVYTTFDGESYIFTGERLQKHVEMMSSRNLTAVLLYMKDIPFSKLESIKYKSCPDRSKCIKEMKYLYQPILEIAQDEEVLQALEAISPGLYPALAQAKEFQYLTGTKGRSVHLQFDSNTGNTEANEKLEKLLQGVHRHVYRGETGKQVVVMWPNPIKLDSDDETGNAHMYNTQIGKYMYYHDHLPAIRTMQVTETEYYCCRQPISCMVEELQMSFLKSVRTLKCDKGEVAILYAKQQIQLAKLQSSERKNLKLAVHKHIYRSLINPDKNLSGEELEMHIWKMSNRNSEQVMKYIIDTNLQRVYEIEYIACPKECIWQNEVQHFPALKSVKCDEDIRYAIELNHMIDLDMPQHHIHMYRRGYMSKLVLSGQNLQRYVDFMYATDYEAGKRQTLENVSNVEYYSCPNSAICVEELKYFHGSVFLKSVKSDRDISEHIRTVMSNAQQSKLELIMPGVHQHVYRDNDNGKIKVNQNLPEHGCQKVSKIEWQSCHNFPNCQAGLPDALFAFPDIEHDNSLDIVCKEMRKLQTIILYNTALGSLPNSIENLKYLQTLIVTNCGLTELPDEIGTLRSLGYLNLSGNPGLTELPSLVANLTQLEFMNLRKCGFKIFPGIVLQLSEKTVIKMTDNPTQVITKEDIKSIMHSGQIIRPLLSYSAPKGLLKSIGRLQVSFCPPSSPPQPVLQSDYAADWLNYFDNCKVSAATKNSTLKSVVILGKTEAGKSSLMRTLAYGIGQKAAPDDRTVVLDELVYSDMQNKIQFNITDFGGHEIYEVAYPIFLTSLSKICIVAVDIKNYTSTKKEEQVIKWLEMATSFMKSGDVKVVATKADMCSESELEANLQCLKKDIKAWKKDWLRFCDLVIDRRSSTSDDSVPVDINQLEKLQHLQAWIEELDLTPITTSAKENEGLQDLTNCMQQSINVCKEVIPQGWFETLEKLHEAKGQKRGTITFDELQSMYYRHSTPFDMAMDIDGEEGADVDMYSDDMFDDTTQNCTDFLQYLHNAGMVLWFPNSKVLKDKVFHDREYLVEILQHLFHHNLRETLKFNPAKPHIQNLTEFTEHLDNFLDCGILSEPLLMCAWNKNQNPGNYDLLPYIIELMQSLNLCFQMNNVTTKSWLFPWFVRKESGEAFLRNEWPPIMKQSDIAAEFCYKFCHRLPLMLYEHLSVAIQKHVYPGDIRHDWKDIIYIRSNGVQMKIQRFPYEEHPSIQISLRTRLSNIQAMYELCLRVNADLQGLLYTCPGVVYDSYLVCPHCLLTGAPHKKHWNLSLIENFARQDWMTCSATKPGTDIPSALVYFMTLGNIFSPRLIFKVI